MYIVKKSISLTKYLTIFLFLSNFFKNEELQKNETYTFKYISK